ncbi:MAG: hypothetical protein DI598_17270 [Pseudopedobacter saltans]|uniref:DUF7674 domain-containing protein n=1 Tax=Pseudopedobacter saltans TaxID=151895 RepID=A0A2W5ELM7_9SPHI|nr:MAG: hypothetical protein DI598_17270 [Pseudopedobacter saltans]
MSQASLDIPNAARYLAFGIPAIKEQILYLSKCKNFAGVLQSIINHQHQLLIEHKMNQLSRTIHFIWNVYRRGNSNIKFLIKNLYLRAQKLFTEKCSPAEWLFIQTHMPKEFIKLSNNLN